MSTENINNEGQYQQNQPGNYQNQWGPQQQQTPNSTAVLVLGILSIVMCWCYAVISIILGVVALILANAGEKEYRLNPQAFSLSSYKNLKAGKTCAIIGLCLAGVFVIFLVIYIILVGTLALNFMNLNLDN